MVRCDSQQPTAVVRDHAFFDGGHPVASPVVATSAQSHLVYPPGVTPTFQVERIDLGTSANPQGVMYRIIPMAGTGHQARRAP